MLLPWILYRLRSARARPETRLRILLERAAAVLAATRIGAVMVTTIVRSSGTRPWIAVRTRLTTSSATRSKRRCGLAERRACAAGELKATTVRVTRLSASLTRHRLARGRGCEPLPGVLLLLRAQYVHCAAS